MQQRRRRRLFPLLALIVVLVVILVPVVGAASTPGNEDFKAKLADWLRSHHGSALVTPIESWYYSQHAPSKGGRLRTLNALPPTERTAEGTAKAGVGTVGLSAPGSIPLVVQPGLSGEGVWQPVGPAVGGTPAMYEAQFRADQTYTGQITSAVWIDPSRLHLSLVPGLTEPGGSWPQPSNLSGSLEQHAVAAFNGGFRFQDAHGGFYLDGRTAVPLQPGAASITIDRRGLVDIGAWGSEVKMTPSTVAVLQNLVPIVDHGRPAASAAYNDSSVWGTTIRSSVVVPRSGIGVTASGAVVYVAGPALSARTLAESLQRVGAVRAMTLDINPEWVTFNYFTHGADGSTAGTKLYPEMQRPSSRYLGPTRESRDFFAVTTPG